MKTRFILSFLKVSVSILFYFLVGFFFVFLCISIVKMVGAYSGRPADIYAYRHEVRSFGMKSQELPFAYSSDSLARYRLMQDKYVLEVRPATVLGMVTLVMKLIFIALGIGVLWNFKKIFQQTDLNNPFKEVITRHLKTLALLFVVSDVFKVIEYILFNGLLTGSVKPYQFQLITDIGSGVVTGMIIWVIAVIYQRGTALQEENALTV